MEITSIAVIGTGTMGRGIAQVAAQSGFTVVVCDVDQATTVAGLVKIRSSLDRAVERGKLDAETRAAANARLSSAPDPLQAAARADLILEAVPDVPVNVNMGFGVRSRPTTPLIPLKRLKEMGVARVSCPRMLTAAAISGMRKALAQMQWCIETGELADRPDLLASMEEITSLAGYEKIEGLEREFSLDEDLERRYGVGERSYVVRAAKEGG